MLISDLISKFLYHVQIFCDRKTLFFIFVFSPANITKAVWATFPWKVLLRHTYMNNYVNMGVFLPFSWLKTDMGFHWRSYNPCTQPSAQSTLVQKDIAVLKWNLGIFFSFVFCRMTSSPCTGTNNNLPSYLGCNYLDICFPWRRSVGGYIHHARRLQPQG